MRPGDTLLDMPGGKIAYTLRQPQVLPVTSTELKEVDGQRWRKVIDREFTGWLKEADHLASPWEWPGFEVVDEPNSPSGASWRDVAQKVGFLLREAPHPEKTPLYQALTKLLDANGDGVVTEQELDAALRNRSRAPQIARLIVRHDSEWAQASATLQQEMARVIARMLGADAPKQVEDEMPRARKLPWWDEVAAGVADFSMSSRVYHFHPVGLAGIFVRPKQKGWELGTTSERYESGGKGPGVVSTGKGDLGGVSYGVYQMSSRMGVVQDYIAGSPLRTEFIGLAAATREFNEKWKEIAARDPVGFRRDQHDYIKRTHYDAQRRLLAKNGLNVEHTRAAIHDMIWSTSVQFGPSTKLILRSIQGLALAAATDIQLIEAVQDYKIANNARLFAGSPALQPGLLARAKGEKARLLNLERLGINLGVDYQ